MKTTLSQAIKKDIGAKSFTLALLALCIIRLLLTAWQRLCLCPEVSMLDDELMYKFAQSIAAGEWLGEYGYLTLGKRALYAVWLALLNKLGVSVLFAGQLLAVSAALCASAALRPLIKNKLHRLIFFAILLFSPNSYADFTLRVYRDNISSSAALIFFASALGLALRAAEGSERSLFAFASLAGLSFAACWLLREDAAWLLPFAMLAGLVFVISIVKKRPRETAKRLSALLLSLALAFAGVGSYCYVNYLHYGRFTTSDLTSPEFTAAYGAMTRTVVPEDERSLIVPVPKSTREKLAAVSPSFAELQPYFESDDFLRWQKDCGDGEIEYSGGGIYWALRNAASLAGYYESPQKAEAFFEGLANEINEAADAGLLGEVLPKRSGLNSPIASYYIFPALDASLESLLRVVSYGDLQNDPENSTGSDALLDEMESFLHCKSQRLYYGEAEGAKKKLVFWAVSKNEPVGAQLLSAEGEPLRCQTIASTAGDVYLDYLLRGEDLRYSSGARLTVFYESEGEAVLKLSSGGESFEVPINEASAMSEPVSGAGVTCLVEYSGSDRATYNEYSFAELWLYRLMRVIVLLYRVLGVILFIAGTLSLVMLIIDAFKKKKSGLDVALCLILSLILMAALRIGMMSFADVSAFGLGVYTMYLAAVYPLMTLWECCALSQYLKGL